MIKIDQNSTIRKLSVKIYKGNKICGIRIIDDNKQPIAVQHFGSPQQRLEFTKHSKWVLGEVPCHCQIIGLQTANSKKGFISRIGFVAR